MSAANQRSALLYKVQAQLIADQSLRVTMAAEHTATGDGIVAVAKRAGNKIETVAIRIPAAKFDPFAILDLFQRTHGGAA